MTTYLKSVTAMVFFSVQMLAAVYICMRAFAKKKNFLLRYFLLFFGCVAVAFLTALITLSGEHTDIIAVIVYYVLSSVIISCFSYYCFDNPFKSVIYCSNIALSAVFFANSIAKTIEIVFVGGGANGEESIYTYAIRFIVFVPCALAFLRFIISRGYKDEMERYSGTETAFMMPVVVATTAVLYVFGYILRDFPFTYRIIFALCETLYGLIMLFINYSLIKQGHSDAELSIMKQLWKEDRKHYEIQKENMEIIQIKCHDLKHQVQNIARNGGMSESAIKEIQESIYIYDSILKTGSEVLDVILSDFSLRCQKSKVMLTCMVDGKHISFMDEMDVYSLFGNLMENALEYEQKVKNEENRFISLTVKEHSGFLSIHCENFFEGDIDVKDGNILTSKSDKNNHGFGIKSMKKIAEKYDGTFDITVQDDMFQINILLPCAAKAGVKKENIT